MLCAIMPYSGFGFGYWMTSTDMEHTFHGLSKCLTYLDSAPLIAKSDNMPAVGTESNSGMFPPLPRHVCNGVCTMASAWKPHV